MMLIVLVYVKKYLAGLFKLHIAIVPDIFKLGLPTALAVLTEIAAFGGSTLIIARISTLQTAAHNIVLTLASITFMVPLSVAIATSVKVARAFGENNQKLVYEYIKSALTLSLGFMTCSALTFFIIPQYVLRIFTSDSELITIGIPILIIAGLFQIFDGAQVTLSGILRGLHVSRPTFFANLAGYWVLGIPLGIYFAYSQNMGATGVWIGLATGLFLVAIRLSFVLRAKVQRVFAITPRSSQ